MVAALIFLTMRQNALRTIYPALVLRWVMDGVGFCVGLWAASIDIRRASVVSIFASDAFIFGACAVVVDDFFLWL